MTRSDYSQLDPVHIPVSIHPFSSTYLQSDCRGKWLCNKNAKAWYCRHPSRGIRRHSQARWDVIPSESVKSITGFPPSWPSPKGGKSFTKYQNHLNRLLSVQRRYPRYLNQTIIKRPSQEDPEQNILFTQYPLMIIRHFTNVDWYCVCKLTDCLHSRLSQHLLIMWF